MPRRNGWGASAVDAFSTACVMQIPDIVNTILEFIPTIDFDKASGHVSLFETTIRYIGGMLSGEGSHMISFCTDLSRLRLSQRPVV
jgi:hypothetical protein